MQPELKLFIERVKNSADIVDVIGRDFDLVSSGSTMKGLSPFTAETEPSFVVWPGTQTFRDFSGGGTLGGDVFEYIQRRDGIPFVAALRKLAAERGIPFPGQGGAAFKQQMALLAEEREIRRLLTEAAAYYHGILPDDVRKKLLRDHYGFSDEIIDRLRLGWSDGQLFQHFTVTLKVKRELALKTGLFVVIKGGQVKDFFQNRLVFPYRKAGQVVYFIGRKTESTPDRPWEGGKYKKLPTHSSKFPYMSETIRNDTLFNEDAARAAEEILITEGVTDCISAMQEGIACISPATVRFRKRDIPKLVQLSRRAKKVLICNDAEQSGTGEAGARETAAALHREGIDVRIATLPRPDGVDKIDVNEFIKGNGGDEFRRILGQAPTYIEFLVCAIPEDTPKTDLAPLLQSVLEAIAGCTPVEVEGYIDLITKRFGLGRRTLQSQLREVRRKVTSTAEITSFRGEVREGDDHYYVRKSDHGSEVISSFIIEPTESVALDDGEIIVGDIHTDRGRTLRGVRFPPTAFVSKRSFIQALPGADMQWTGTDDNVQGVKRVLASRDLPVRTGTQMLGYHETPNGPRWVAEGLLLASDGPCPSDELAFVPNGSSFPGRVRYRIASDSECRDLAEKVLPSLLELNEPRVLLPALGWFFATPFKPRIMELLGHFPILVVWGTKGSGKTTLVKEVLWPLSGVSAISTEPYSATETEFPLLKLFSSTNSVPVFIDEYRPYDMPPRRLHALHRLLRRIYGSEVEERGRPNLSVTSYKLTAPVCLAGESRPDDPALVDRIVSVTPDANRLEAHPEHRDALYRLKRIDLGLLAAPYIQWTLTRDAEADLEEAERITDQVLSAVPGGDEVAIRSRDNYRVIVLGLRMFEEFARHMGIASLPALDLNAALASSIADLGDGEGGAKNALDRFIETCSVLAHERRLQKDHHYAIVNGHLCLHLPSAWNLYLEHQHRIGQRVDTDVRALRRMAHENHSRGSYVRETSKTVKLGTKRLRTIVIDLDRAAQFLELDGFPGSQNRTWGGSRSPQP